MSNLQLKENVSELTVKMITEEVTRDVDVNSWRDISWWKDMSRRERYRLEDIVYVEGLNKFGIFIEPAKKEGLVLVRLFKVKSKYEVYTRDWYLNIGDIELVKRKDKIEKKYVETDREFIKRAN